MLLVATQVISLKAKRSEGVTFRISGRVTENRAVESLVVVALAAVLLRG